MGATGTLGGVAGVLEPGPMPDRGYAEKAFQCGEQAPRILAACPPTACRNVLEQKWTAVANEAIRRTEDDAQYETRAQMSEAAREREGEAAVARERAQAQAQARLDEAAREAAECARAAAAARTAPRPSAGGGDCNSRCVMAGLQCAGRCADSDDACGNRCAAATQRCRAGCP